MSVEIIEWNELVSWNWDLVEDFCGFCQSSLDSCCANCSIPGDSCPPIVGKCGHAFHKHCLEQWLEKQNTCPACRKEWLTEDNFMETV